MQGRAGLPWALFHRFPRSARAGVRWWEVDPIYYAIPLWGVREIPAGNANP